MKIKLFTSIGLSIFVLIGGIYFISSHKDLEKVNTTRYHYYLTGAVIKTESKYYTYKPTYGQIFNDVGLLYSADTSKFNRNEHPVSATINIPFKQTMVHKRYIRDLDSITLWMTIVHVSRSTAQKLINLINNSADIDLTEEFVKKEVKSSSVFEKIKTYTFFD